MNGDQTHDDDFDRPRPTKKSGRGTLIALICLGALLIGGLIFALIYFLGGSNNLDSEMLAYLPPETNLMAGVEVEELMKNDKVKNLVTGLLQNEGKDFYAKLKEAGMSENDFTRILIGGDMDMFGMRALRDGPREEPNMVIVIRAKKAYDKAKIAQVVGLQEANKNGKTYYKSTKAKDLLVYYPTDTLAVLTPNEKTLEGAMSRDSGKVVVSEEMQELGKKLSKGHVWFALNTTHLRDGLKQIKGQKIPDVPEELIDALAGMRGVGAYAKLDGDNLTFGGGILCEDRSTASKAADALQKKIEEMRGKSLDDNPLFKGKIDGMPSEVKTLIADIQKSSKADHSGAMLEMSATCSVSGHETLFKSLMAFPARQRAEAAERVHQPDFPEAQPKFPPFVPKDTPRPQDFFKDAPFPPKDVPLRLKDAPQIPKDIPLPPKDFPSIKDALKSPIPLKDLPPLPKDLPKLDGLKSPESPKDASKFDVKDSLSPPK
jgi:hypothetical protein